ncbi:superoxide dismutase family protein [Shewanella sp. D64]|uniref:superoxide dismutase family protein n=1 Tax=unclassified Shewanella TaxID=196818 RepID=UPI0022BA216A|nr:MULTISPECIES: superoxide dismutase family protein [unclassified Shewanella]MEC4728217.1 superoxide dismutase family protein [Shewanella sp. D64]MEC4740014.1 superoxide dismutase family protein [Shewanella sp. E94]WBJ94370.1 superoxide dismutase family protein [Shewanella sp. MTB7]
MKKSILMIALLCGLTGSAVARDLENLTFEMKDLTTGKIVGDIVVDKSQYGVIFTPHLDKLSPGLHGFHVHQNPHCDNSMKNGKAIVGGAAGGHYDPEKTNKHGYPWGAGNHKGDLPALYVDLKGQAHNPVLAPKLTLKELKGRSLMIHVGGDNHSDHPMVLGGGGSRMVCGTAK